MLCIFLFSNILVLVSVLEDPQAFLGNHTWDTSPLKATTHAHIYSHLLSIMSNLHISMFLYSRKETHMCQTPQLTVTRAQDFTRT